MKQKQKTLLALLAAVAVLGVAFFALSRHNAKNAAAQSQAAEEAVIHVVSGIEPTTISYVYQGETVDLAKTDTVWQLTGDPDFTVSANLTANMAGKFEDFTANRRLERDAATDYGFDAPSMTVTVTAGDGSTTLVWGAKNTVTGDYYLQKQGEDNTVYTVPSATIQAFQYTRAELYSGITLLDVSADDVTGLTLTKADGSTLAFTKTELKAEADSSAPAGEESESTFTWNLADDPAATVVQGTVAKAVDALCGQTTQWAYTGLAADADLTAYGFGEETLTATLTLADGTQKVLLVADGLDGDGNRCVKEPESSIVYSLTPNTLAPLDTDFAAYTAE